MKKIRVFGEAPSGLETQLTDAGIAVQPARLQMFQKGGRQRGKKLIKSISFDETQRPRQVQYELSHGEAAEISAELLKTPEKQVSQKNVPGYETALLEDSLSIDLPLMPMAANPQSTGQHWSIGGANNVSFGARAQAEALVLSACPVDRSGANIGVIVLDVGVSTDYIDGTFGDGRIEGGWIPDLSRPGETDTPLLFSPGEYANPLIRADSGHGNMVARNVLKLAPKAVIYDAPILPEKILNIETFTSHARTVLDAIHEVVTYEGDDSDVPRHDHWILVNAWAAADRLADVSNCMSYSGNRNHRLNSKFIELALLDNVDVVFAAGNNGAFQPANHSGPYDRGFGNSIWGANALPEVFTIGGVRVDGMAIGASSQGPGRRSMSLNNEATNRKPDFCCPSWFCENGDPGVLNTGSSAAVAVFAGLLASIRSCLDPMSTHDLKQKLQGSRSWNAQMGYGLPRL